jgi:hypothetical protein
VVPGGSLPEVLTRARGEVFPVEKVSDPDSF